MLQFGQNAHTLARIIRVDFIEHLWFPKADLISWNLSTLMKLFPKEGGNNNIFLSAIKNYQNTKEELKALIVR